MWENPKPGEAEFRANGWKLVVRTTQQGVDLLACRDGLGASSARLWLPQTEFTACRESFIRGDALHLALSDTATEPIGLDLTLMAVEADESSLILELVISLATSLLDSHPAVELQVGAGQPGHLCWDDTPWVPLEDSGAAVWLQAHLNPPGDDPKIVTSVLCDDRDRLSLDSQGLADAGRLRFFGDFLEKGVIRKVQPWLVWSGGGVPVRSRALIAGQLANRPLPLTN
jgi:hypothetical protein